MLKFAWIWMFLALPLPLIVRRWYPKFDCKPISLRIPHFTSVLEAGGSGASSARISVLAVALAWIFLIAAASRPTWVELSDNIAASGRDMILAVDASGSMKHNDFTRGQRSRFSAVQEIAGNFVRGRKGDRVGLIVFGTRPYLHAPLTYDTDTVAQFLDETRVGFAGQRTAIGDTIGLAVKVLRDRPQASRVLVILTDGENTDGQISPAQAAQLAQRHDVRVYAIGIGDALSGSATAYTQRRIDSLQHIAKETQGSYFHASDPESLAQIYDLIDEFEPIDFDDRRFVASTELYAWPLALALGLFALVIWMRWMPKLKLGDSSERMRDSAA